MDLSAVITLLTLYEGGAVSPTNKRPTPKDFGIDLSLIGVFGLVGLPYSLKFTWAPFLDKFSLTFLGRRRGWLLLSQILIILTMVGIYSIDISTQLIPLGMLCLMLSFFSATQDILVDTVVELSASCVPHVNLVNAIP